MKLGVRAWLAVFNGEYGIVFETSRAKAKMHVASVLNCTRQIPIKIIFKNTTVRRACQYDNIMIDGEKPKAGKGYDRAYLNSQIFDYNKEEVR